jgi:hypothetical protein
MDSLHEVVQVYLLSPLCDFRGKEMIPFVESCRDLLAGWGLFLRLRQESVRCERGHARAAVTEFLNPLKPGAG